MGTAVSLALPLALADPVLIGGVTADGDGQPVTLVALFLMARW
jgi:hypothetical protein